MNVQTDTTIIIIINCTLNRLKIQEEEEDDTAAITKYILSMVEGIKQYPFLTKTFIASI